MSGPDLLARAVAEGIISADQERRLQELDAAMTVERGDAIQERFRVIRDFNDVFISIGVVLVTVAMHFLIPALTGAGAEAGSVAGASLVAPLAAAALLWGLSELLVHRRRSALTGLVLLIAISSFVVAPLAEIVDTLVARTAVAGALPDGSFWLGDTARTVEVFGLLSLLFFARFKLPIALGLFAACASVSMLLLVGGGTGQGAIFRTAAVGIGLVILAAAVALDIADRLRATWRADAAFWLHAVSAPYIVIGVIGPQVFGILKSGLFVLEVSSGQWALLVASLLTLLFVAVVIDRRSLILSSVLAWAVVLYNAFGSVAGGTGGSIAPILLTLGISVMALGTFWQPIRRAVHGATPWLPAWRYLSPVGRRQGL